MLPDSCTALPTFRHNTGCQHSSLINATPRPATRGGRRAASRRAAIERALVAARELGTPACWVECCRRARRRWAKAALRASSRWRSARDVSQRQGALQDWPTLTQKQASRTDTPHDPVLSPSNRQTSPPKNSKTARKAPKPQAELDRVHGESHMIQIEYAPKRVFCETR